MHDVAADYSAIHTHNDLNMGYVLTGLNSSEEAFGKTMRTLLVEVDADIGHVILKNKKKH